MKLLLDTHAFIWWDNEPEKLSRKALQACLNPDNVVALSLASVWELQIKMQVGKLTLRLPLAEVLSSQQQNGITIELITMEDILGLSSLPMLHRDPFDRLLIAQATRGGFHLVSHDSQLSQYDTPIYW